MLGSFMKLSRMPSYTSFLGVSKLGSRFLTLLEVQLIFRPLKKTYILLELLYCKCQHVGPQG